ncbi:MAG: Bug family tripartite tricarboxylate transporter substrate binding protein [Gemmatimonas sp.]
MNDASLKRLAALALTGTFLVSPALAQSDPAAFYKGRNVDLIIGAAPGGGHDIYARAIARHIGKHIPGNPNVVPKNMPGAGSNKAAAFLYNVAPKDGSVFGAIFPGAVMDPLTGDKSQVQHDPQKFNYLGTANKEVRVCAVWHTAPAQSFKDVFNTETILAASAEGGATADYAAVLDAVLGTKFKVVRGYPGTRDMTLAIERGEAHGLCGYAWTSLKTQNAEWVNSGKIKVILQTAFEGDPELNKMGVPLVWEFVKNEDDRKVIELLLAQQVFGRPYVAPPGTPAAMVKVLRAAFADTMKDKDYVAEANKLGLETDFGTGEEVQQLVDKVYATPAAIVQRLVKATSTK